MKSVLILAMSLMAIPSLADITIYTDRPVARFANAVKMFESQFGQKVQLVEGSYGELLKRLSLEGKGTPADLIVTKDLVYLGELKAKGHLKSFNPSPSFSKIHSFMKADDLSWVGLTFRVRTAAFDPSRVDRSELTTYEDLANSKWAGRLCLRTSKSAYNEALGASLIFNYGAVRTKNIVHGWLENLAVPVFASDTVVLEEIAKGNCDVGIVNHYYLGQLLAQRPNFPVRIAFLNQQEGGVHTNGTGVGMITHSAKGVLAQKFVDILLSDTIQMELSSAHFDYPAVKHLTPSSLIKDWGKFTMNATLWSEIGKLAPEARKLMDAVGYK